MSETTAGIIDQLVEDTVAWHPYLKGSFKSAKDDPSKALQLIEETIALNQLNSQDWARLRSNKVSASQREAYQYRIRLVSALDGLRWAWYKLALMQCRSEGREEPTRPGYPRMY